MYPFCSWLAHLISLPMHWAKAVFPLFKEPGGAAAALTLISCSSHTPMACQWELGPRRRVENADEKVNLLCHPWVSQAKKCFAGVYSGEIWSLCSMSWELLITACGALPGFLSTTCSRGDGSPCYLVTSQCHGMGNELFVCSTFCHVGCPCCRQQYDSIFLVACTCWKSCLSNSFPMPPLQAGSSVRSSAPPASRGPSSVISCWTVCTETLKCVPPLYVLFQWWYLSRSF